MKDLGNDLLDEVRYLCVLCTIYREMEGLRQGFKAKQAEYYEVWVS